jgi:hypothetical protein
LAPIGVQLLDPLHVHLGGKCFAHDEEAETKVRKWLRQQSKDFHAVGFDTLVNRRDMCINVNRHVEK